VRRQLWQNGYRINGGRDHLPLQLLARH
jgi:hypothetical protein